MIDSTKSPVPAWKRHTTIGVLAVLILMAAFVLWTKELHHSAPSASSPPATASTPAVGTATHAKVGPTTTTTIPGGLPISPRNPFGG